MRALHVILLLGSINEGRVHAQWQVVAGGDHLPIVAYDAAIGVGDSLHVLANTGDLVGSVPAQSFVWTFTNEGGLIDTTAIQWPEGMSFGTHIYWNSLSGSLVATGMTADTGQMNSPTWMRGFVADLNGNTVQVGQFGPPVNYCTDGLGFIDADGSIVIGHYDYQDPILDDLKFRITRFCPGQGVCDSVLVHEQVGIGRFHGLDKLPNGNIAAVLPNVHPSCSPSIDCMINLSNELDTLGCAPILPVDTGVFNSPSGFKDNLSILPLTSGNLLMIGQYQRIMQPEWWHPIAIERIGANGDILALRRFYNSVDPSIMMRPAIMRGISPFDESTFALAYSDFAFTGSPWPYAEETSNVHVIRMDTALNILGEYVFNGDVINRYHFLSSVVASPDGAVYVVGSVVDHGDVNPQPKAWIARVAPEQFVTIPEVMQANLWLAPNPGSIGFLVRSENTILRGRIEVLDIHGRLLLTALLNGNSQWVDASMLASGLHMVRVTAADGSTWTARWVKE